MNVDELHKKLMAVARLNPPSNAVPYGFEKRIMARMAAVVVPDFWALWSRMLWRAAVPCVSVMLLLTAWTLFAENSTGNHEVLGPDLESTVLAAIDHPGDSW